MSHFAVFVGGSLTVTERLRRQIDGARLIAADSGIAHCKVLGVTPELWLGDFDSTNAGLEEAHKRVPRQKFPEAKAMTDGELAVQEALRRGASRLVIVGAFGGGRSDHAMYHVTLMLALAERGIDIFLTSGNEEARPLLRQKTAVDAPNGTIASIVAFDDLKGLTIDGARWALANHDVKFGSSLTLSNEISGRFSASVREGRAVIFLNFSGG